MHHDLAAADLTLIHGPTVLDVELCMIELVRSPDEAKWREYAARMLTGEMPPPVFLIRQSVNTLLRVFDGCHRIHAARHLGLETIAAVIAESSK